MKVVILAGGLGSRLAEETEVRPKPMVEIGNLPILWHIMKTYSAHNLHEFIICCGYKGYVIKNTLPTISSTALMSPLTCRITRWKSTKSMLSLGG